MRLLSTRTLKLKTFFNKIPPYAILSHCWEDEEVVFSDLDDLEQARKKKGFEKLQKTCELAIEDGYQYAWIDTCCIDKSSSAELSEAINSMFTWYRNSAQCYAYLADTYLPRLKPSETIGIGADTELPVHFAGSKWFKRAWTLQELLAPRSINSAGRDGMKFYSNNCDVPLATEQENAKGWLRGSPYTRITDKYGLVDYYQYAKLRESIVMERSNEGYTADNVTSSDLDLNVTITPKKVLLQDMFIVDIELGGLYESVAVEEFIAGRIWLKKRRSDETQADADQDSFTPGSSGGRVSQSSVLAALGFRRDPTEWR